MIRKPLYVVYDQKAPHCPLAVGDNMADLQRLTGRSISSLCASMARARRRGWSDVIATVWCEFTESEYEEVYGSR